MLPKHIALIPDGNRRWAKAKGLPSFVGHQAGAEMAEKVLDHAYKIGIKYVTFWAGSISNLTKRSTLEVMFLFELYEKFFNKLLNSKILTERQARVKIFGAWDKICPTSLRAVIKKLEDTSAAYNDRHLTFLLAYNGTDEILKTADSLIKSGIRPPITPEIFKQHLFTKDLPPVDLLIRTGIENDPHNSTGFMMWDTAEAQIYYTNKQWPDFTPEEFDKALADYSARERRLGG